MSPYGYCVGNPVKLVDVDGMKFTDAMEEMAQQEEKYADKRIDENSTKLEKRGERKFFISKIKNNRLRNEISRYEEAKKEIAEMRASDQMYDFQTYYRAPGTDYDKNGLPYDRHYGGYVSYDQDKEVFIINLNSYEGINIGDFAHELKHGYQFETGRLSMKGKTTSGMANGGYLYDYTDEIEAHQRGADFGSSLPVHPDPNVYSKLPREERNADDIYKWAVKFYKGKGTEFDHEIYKH